MKRHPTARNRMSLALMHGIAALAATGAVRAQQAEPAPAPQAEAPQQEDVTQLEAVQVVATGSRIARAGYDAPTPVTVARTEELLLTTPTSVPDGLNKLPQFQLSSSPARSQHNYANSASHGNVLNLRGVGGSRSLILFDGLRVPATTYLGTVDVDVLPSALVSHVDVVTAGASAAYGSDAVAGVVNFVLDRDYVGMKGSAQYGVSEQGDNAHHRLTAAGGWNLFAESAGHLLLSAEHSKHDGMLRGDRAFANRGYNYVGANPGAGAPGSAANPFVIATGVRTNSATDGGLIIGGPLAGNRFLPDGSITPFNAGTPTGTAGLAIDSDGFYITPDVTAVAPQDSKKAFARLGYDFGNGISAWVQGAASRTELSYLSLANSMVAPTNVVIRLDNPFLDLTAAQRGALAAAGADSLAVAAFNSYAPKPETRERTDFWMLTGGLEGSLAGDWRWNAAWTRAESRHRMDQTGVSDWRRAYAAIDAVRDAGGDIVCRATLHPDPVVRDRYADCRPLNVLGEGAMLTTPDGYAYVAGTSSYRATMDQDTFAATLGGTLGRLPAGPIDAAFGLEYRRQRLDLTSNADPALLATPEQRAEYFHGLDGVSSAALFYALTNVGAAHGSVSVKEGFAELNLPLLSDAPLAHSLELNMAARATDYSTSGMVRTWKLGATWRPVEDLLLRATRSRDIRAPSVFDLYAGPQGNIGRVIDPVTGRSDVAAQFAVGNPELTPEIAGTVAIGGAWTPQSLPGLSLSIDYYRLKIDDAIGTLSANEVLQNCHASGGAAPECAQITRPAPDQFPSLILTVPENIAYLETSGVDFDLSYRTGLGPGNLSLRLFASWLRSFEQQQSAAAPVYEYAGRGAYMAANSWARPKWRGSLNLRYDVGDWSLSLSEQYIGAFRLGSQEPNQIYADPDVAAVWTTDATLAYYLGKAELFLTVNNLFDREPPLIPATTPGASLPTINAVYDTVGRAYTAGVRVSF